MNEPFDYETHLALLKVVESHLPELKLGQYSSVLINKRHMTDPAEVRSVRHEDQVQLLEQIEKSLQDAWMAYAGLHDDVRRELEGSFKMNIKERPAHKELRVFVDYKDEGGDVGKTPYHENSLLGLLLMKACNHVMNFDPDDDRVNAESLGKTATSSATHVLRFMDDQNNQEVANATWKKVALVQNSRELWHQAKGASPPKERKNGPFVEFVSDLINALGEDWEVESTLKAWNARRKKSESFSLN